VPVNDCSDSNLSKHYHHVAHKNMPNALQVSQRQVLVCLTLVVTWLIEIVRCPRCGGSFQAEAYEDERVSEKHRDVIEGRLVCVKCKASYDIKGGIPIFVDREG
jgi:uncharacterized protein YbaR (Trm112 family)